MNDYCEATGPEPDKKSMAISFSRRKQLMAFATKLAEQVLEKIEKHERCLVRSMVENLLGR